MKTPNLLDVPKMAPNRRDKLAAFKAKHGIETHNCAGMRRKDEPWSACLMPRAYSIGEGYGVKPGDSLASVVAQICRLLQESEVLCTGETESGAIRNLCAANGIHCEV